MPNFQQKLKQVIKRSSGQIFWKKVTITSSQIVTATKLAITNAATADLLIAAIVVKTDATGLAGGTNFVIGSTNTLGNVNIAVETVANLGANVTKSYNSPPAADTTTADAGFTVTQQVTVLEAGQNMWVNCTGSNCTGTGKIDVFIKFERITDNGDIQAALVAGV